jgi:hypothetical protein
MSKMITIFVAAFVTSSGVFLTPLAIADDVGNGVDPLRRLFDSARVSLGERIRELKTCSWDQTMVAEEVGTWILSNRTRLIDDIAGSRHTWITDLNSTCAMTMAESMAPIIFSYPACNPHVTEQGHAEPILAHESVHHLGHTDEIFPEEVAEAIKYGNPDCQVQIPGDVFNPNSCQGTPLTDAERLAWFEPATTRSNDVVHMRAFQRTRRCHDQTGCVDWSETTPPEWYTYYFNDRSGEVLTVVNAPQNITVNFLADSTNMYHDYKIANSIFSMDVSDTTSYGFRRGNENLYSPIFSGKLTRECARYSSTDTKIGSDGIYWEKHTVYYGNVLEP